VLDPGDLEAVRRHFDDEAGQALVTLGGGSTVGGWLALVGACVVIGLGVLIGRRGDASRRERAWELEAIGVGLLAAAWLAGARPGS